ncbi:MAG: histidinol dehydrogenase [Actinomycetota bacterium]
MNGGVVLVDDLAEAVEVANAYAAEHLQVAVDPRRAEGVVEAIVNAGEILVGQDTPFSAANFVIGCPASLPTSGFAHVSSGITVNAFLKRTAIARANESALRRMAPSIVSLADHEGFPAHGNAIRRRFDGPSDTGTTRTGRDPPRGWRRLRTERRPSPSPGDPCGGAASNPRSPCAGRCGCPRRRSTRAPS